MPCACKFIQEEQKIYDNDIQSKTIPAKQKSCFHKEKIFLGLHVTLFKKNLLVIKAYDDVQAKNRESSCAIGGIAQPLSEEHVLLTH